MIEYQSWLWPKWTRAAQRMQLCCGYWCVTYLGWDLQSPAGENSTLTVQLCWPAHNTALPDTLETWLRNFSSWLLWDCCSQQNKTTPPTSLTLLDFIISFSMLLLYWVFWIKASMQWDFYGSQERSISLLGDADKSITFFWGLKTSDVQILLFQQLISSFPTCVFHHPFLVLLTQWNQWKIRNTYFASVLGLER